MTHVDRLPFCFLRQFSDRSCDGRLVRCHLVSRHVLKRELKAGSEMIDDPRTWVWGCGGINGSSGHHGALDVARTLRIPRERLPTGFLEFLCENGLGWYADRYYPVAA